MMSTKDSNPQSNPESEPGVNGEAISTNRPALPLSVKIDAAKIDAAKMDEHGQTDGVEGMAAANGANSINGTHHDDEPASDQPASDHLDSADLDSDAPVNQPVEADAVGAIEQTLDLAGGAAATDDAAATEDTATATSGLSTLRSAVKIKGRPGGVSLELGEGEWDELMLLLEERLNAAEGFFRGGRVLLDVGVRPLIEENLRQVRQLLETHEMHLAVVRSTAERTLQAAVEVGVSTTIEDVQESLPTVEPPLIVPDGPPNAYTPSPYGAPPELLPNRPNHFVHRGSLRSGQVLRKTESIVIIGDVNPGAQVVSGGDIMVWGRLRGIAHAGAEGNRRAVVAAIDFVPTQLRIANLTAIAPEPKKARGGGLFFWKKEPERRPEIAHVVNGHIVVDPWDEGKNKPSGLSVWRR
jgi:septum site-determining protein MinC